uniref:Calcium-dependent protein kinase C n=1 Tax=Schistosoma haematobium TaxID=6185 RepID=A0A094ZLI7_SCHHA
MEFVNGGDLMFRIQKEGKFKEPIAVFYAAEVAVGLFFLHDKGIIYRSVFLSFLILLCIVFCVCLKDHIYLHIAVLFTLPIYKQILLYKPYGKSVDWWSYGVLLYEMLAGQPPFEGEDEEDLFANILQHTISYPKSLSKESVSICKALSPRDTSNFDSEFTKVTPELSPTDKLFVMNLTQTEFSGFSFVNPEFIVEVPDDRPSIWRPYFYSLVYTLLSGLVVFYLKKYFRWCEFNTAVPTVAYFTHESWKKLSTDFITDLIKNNIIQNKINNNSMSLIYSNETINKTYILTYSIGRLSMKPFGKGFRLVINANYHLLSLKNLFNQTELNSNIQYSIQPCLSLNQRLKLNNGLFEFLRKLKIELPGIYAPSLLSTKSAFKTLLSFRSLVYSIGFRRFWIAKLDILDFFNQIIHSKLVEVFSDTLNEIDGKLYSFIKGIPQGSCISSDLANIYLAHLDRQLHRTQTILWSPHKFLQNDVFKTTDIHLNKCSIILRYLDDYLCISTSKIELQNLIKRINTSLNSYGLLLNEQKLQTNLYDSNVPIKWLGIEVHSSLAITLPKSNSPPRFCRFSGQSLSANDCMRRLCKFRLHCPTWRFTFHKIIYNTNIRQNVFICKNANIRKTDYLLQINANRLGNKIADIVWISLKTSPEKDRLLLPSVSRRLANKLVSSN